MIRRSIKNFIEKFTSLDKKTAVILVIGLVGIFLIGISELLPDKKTAQEKPAAVSDDPVTEDTFDYKRQVERELKELLEQIRGVGEVTVMVTIEGTTEYVYAEELNTESDKDGERASQSYENRIVMTGKNGEEKALVKQIIRPKISGVIVVCEGGGNITTNERVLRAVSTALDLPSNKICVECRK